MNSESFIKICGKALEILKMLAPIKTGNLRHNAIKMEVETQNTVRLWVDEAIAPYMPYTNEEWEHKLIQIGNFVKGQVVERMRTWNNPNEGWFNRASQAVAEFIAQEIKSLK